MAQLEEKLTKLLEKIASEHGYKNYKLDISSISTGGGNYTSVLYKAKVGENNKDDLNLFAKVAVMSDNMREQCEFKIYEAERYVYTTIMRIFTELEDRHNVAKSNRLIFTKYYGAHTKINEEILVLEDLTTKGFSTYDRHKSIDWPYASASVKALAKFHALAMAFQKEYPEEHYNFAREYETVWITEDVYNSFIQCGFDKAVEAVRDENRGKLKTFFDKLDTKKVIELHNPCRKPVLTHTDYRMSNLMHRYTEDGSVQVIPVDLQTIRLGCVIVDLLFFIFTGTDQEFRRLYYQRLVNYYFTELTAAMARLGVESSYYTKDDFNFELKERLPYGLVVAGFGLPLITVAPEDAPKVGDLTNFVNLKTSNLYSERLNGVVDDYVQWGVL